ncbi:Protein-tyrosine-phosphatase (Fragment) [Durusdinium trenchii]|uniref:Protein-tyrosine-phosphatase n=1 Tax=Durusdinium trenchii TaxID=1381693 RepID=A0ABP0QMM9_9DINO
MASSRGTDLPTGCTCKAGFSGSVTATPLGSPQFCATWLQLQDGLHRHHYGDQQWLGDGKNGDREVFGWKPKPGDTIGDTQDATPGDGDGVGGSGQTELCCETVACPGNSAGASVSAGCSCDAGFSGPGRPEEGGGAVTPSSKSPFYENGCTAVQCPVHSTGKTVPSGCSCNAGYSGSITASSQTPFFAGSCEAISGSLREDVQSERRRERLAASTKTEDEELVLSVRLLEERKRRMET